MADHAGRAVFEVGIDDPRGNRQVGALAYVYLRGTSTLATLYTDRTKATPRDNPVSTNGLGNLAIFADPGDYDAVINGATLQFTVLPDWEDVLVTSTPEAGLPAHLTDAVDAHDASAVSVVPVGNIAATDVQAALAELDSDKEPSIPPGTYAGTPDGSPRTALTTDGPAQTVGKATRFSSDFYVISGKPTWDIDATAGGDITAQWQAYVNAAKAGDGGKIRFGPRLNGFTLTAPIDFSGMNGRALVIEGLDEYVSTIRPNFDGDVFLLGGERFIEFRNLAFSPSIARTTGAMFKTTGNGSDLVFENLRLLSCWDGFELNDTDNVTLDHVRMIDGPAGSKWRYAVWSHGGSAALQMDDVKLLTSLEQTVDTWFLRIEDADTLRMRSCAAQKSGASTVNLGGVWITRGQWLHLTDSFMEVGKLGRAGVRVDGAAYGVELKGMHLTTSRVGLEVTADSGSRPRDVKMIGGRASFNGEHGILLDGPAELVGVEVSNNSVTATGVSDGVHVNAGISDWSVIGGRIGRFDDPAGTQHRYNIRVDDGASDRYNIIGPKMSDAATADLYDGGSGTSKVILTPGKSSVAGADVAVAGSLSRLDSYGPSTTSITPPAWARSAVVKVGAGGGGGGSGRKGPAGEASTGGAGGGAGGVSEMTVNVADVSWPLTLTIGTGGGGGAATMANGTNGTNGAGGSASWFGSSAAAALVATAGGGGGAGGSAAGAATGGTAGAGITTPGAGASSAAAGGVGTTPSTAPLTVGGASGAGISTANAAFAGGAGGIINVRRGATVPAAGAIGANGGDAVAPAGASPVGGHGGGGGGSSVTGDAGRGGHAIQGSGGGGGGASRDSTGNSGAGGDGGPGFGTILWRG